MQLSITAGMPVLLKAGQHVLQRYFYHLIKNLYQTALYPALPAGDTVATAGIAACFGKKASSMFCIAVFYHLINSFYMKQSLVRRSWPVLLVAAAGMPAPLWAIRQVLQQIFIYHVYHLFLLLFCLHGCAKQDTPCLYFFSLPVDKNFLFLITFSTALLPVAPHLMRGCRHAILLR